MQRQFRACRLRRAFTLVEMLIVIIVIAILAGLITAATIAARNRVRVALIRNELAQLEMALEQYKNKFGEYPPDFAFVNHPDATTQSWARQRVINHIRKRWPRCQINSWDQFVQVLASNYPQLVKGPQFFNGASALLFWLGGLPEDGSATKWQPKGFANDPFNPFRPGTSREAPLFTFQEDRIVQAADGSWWYVPQKPSMPSGPYVYFRSYRLPQTLKYEYGVLVGPTLEIARYDTGEYGVAVAYFDRWLNPPNDPFQPNVDRPWRNEEKFQIVSPGLDGQYGPASGVQDLVRITRTDLLPEEDYDNITNFSQGTLEDEIE